MYNSSDPQAFQPGVEAPHCSCLQCRYFPLTAKEETFPEGESHHSPPPHWPYKHGQTQIKISSLQSDKLRQVNPSAPSSNTFQQDSLEWINGKHPSSTSQLMVLSYSHTTNYIIYLVSWKKCNWWDKCYSRQAPPVFFFMKNKMSGGLTRGEIRKVHFTWEEQLSAENLPRKRHGNRQPQQAEGPQYKVCFPSL